MTWCDFIVSIISSGAVGAVATCYLMDYFNKKGESRRKAEETIGDLDDYLEDVIHWLDYEALRNKNGDDKEDGRVKAEAIIRMVRALRKIKRKASYLHIPGLDKKFSDLIKLTKGLISARSKKYRKDEKNKKLINDGWEYINSAREKADQLCKSIREDLETFIN